MSHGELHIRLFGGLTIQRDDQPVKLPQSKKTRALLGYLIAAKRSHTREHLCSLLWDVTDDPRGALRWSLSKLRTLVDDADTKRILTVGKTVQFRAQGAYVDLHALRAIDPQAAEAPELLSLADHFTGDFLDGEDMPDFLEYRAWRVAEQEDIRRRQCHVLEALLERLKDDPERAVSFARHLVHLQPTHARARADLLGLLARTDRMREAEQQYAVGLEALESAGQDSQPLRQAWKALEGNAPAAKPRTVANQHRQDIRFCTTEDGARIAYATVGEGPVIIKAANWLSHLEYDWESPVWSHLHGELGAQNTYVRYDERGSGLSDCDDCNFSFETMVADLEAVVDAVGAERFVLLGVSKGASVSIEYAVRHPERVAGLLLMGGFALGWEKRANETGKERNNAMTTLIRTGWGSNNPAFRQIFTSLFLPGGDLETIHSFNELQRISATPENAARLREATGAIDVRDRLAHVTAPTLVMHVSDDAVVSFENGRNLASAIPGARFVTLEGENHLPLENDPGWPRFVEEKRRFLAEVAPAD